MNCFKLRKAAPMAAVFGLFVLLLIYSADAVAGAARGVQLCANVIVPTLLPFFVLSQLLCALDLPGYLGRYFEGFFRSLFGVSGAGVSAFIMGITGSYPLGAATAAELYRSGAIKKEEAKRLLRFCNNSGPAFIVGMAGVGVFRSSKIGLLLYFTHVLSALLVGALLCRDGSGKPSGRCAVCALDLGRAITEAMTKAIKSTALISGFIIFFSMLTALLESSGLYTALEWLLCEHTSLSPGQSRGVILGLMELGSGISSMAGLEATPENLAICAFILGWGGLSVQFQTGAVLNRAGLESGGAVLSKLLHGVLSAAIVYIFAMM